MTDDALAQAAEAAQPTIQPYEPFPPFEHWLSAPFDSSAFDRFVSQLDDLRASTQPAMLEDAVRIATKWAAINTGAIEGLFQVDRGFTYSVAVSSAAWENIHAVKGEFAAASIEDAVRAYDFVLDAATGAHPITEVWVRELHQIVTSSQEKYTVITEVGSQEQDLPKGEYKLYPNNPLNFDSNVVHSYAPPIDTPSEMARLIEEMRSKAFADAHPVVQAAYAHYAFVCIHPFADGNGRVARALAATFLYRAFGVPLVIFADQKADYLDALEAADAGSPAQFLRFVSERVIDTVAMIKEQVLTAATPAVSDQLAVMRSMLSGHGGLSHGEIDAITVRMKQAFGAALAKQLKEEALSAPLSGQAITVSASVRNRPTDYRLVPSDGSYVGIQIQGEAPAAANTAAYYIGMTRLPSASVPDFAVVRQDGHVALTAELRELHPTISQAFVFRAEAAALREFRRLVLEAAAQAEYSLREAGYL
ncbi:Fic family protein [Microbacterium sp. ACRRU]|uniref:Fic family protein n=1 Tax=Microbacterium sp. ACRRU TaxID=2918204 RepID=UPI001EF4EA30|nr:Fic family protein [Microbacterium sp. ACRRU]MCG7417329.1 Fic family protein [Microbacterium sp. ACRRU]